MNTERVSFVMLLAAAPAVTVFPLVYGLTLPWFRSLIGRGLMVTSLGLGGLIDISLAYRIFGSDYQARDPLRLLVFGFITVGMWMLLLALLRGQLKQRALDVDLADRKRKAQR